MSSTSSLWIGDLTEYMDENFLSQGCSALGEYGVKNVKIIRNKFTNKSMGYGFLQFADENSAMETLTRLQGKVIPGSNPPVRFKLNHGVYKKTTEREYSLWVGDIDKDVGEDELYRAFSRYASMRTARILRLPTGQSKGYGFVRFTNEDDYKDALLQMNGYRGIGTRALKVSPAIPRKDSGPEYGETPTHAATTTPVDYSYYYDHSSYWNNATGWDGYDSMADAYYATGAGSYRYGDPAASAIAGSAGADGVGGSGDSAMTGGAGGQGDDAYDEFAIVEHDVPVDIDEMNRDILQKSEEFWDALENSRWLFPDFEDIYGLNETHDH